MDETETHTFKTIKVIMWLCIFKNKMKKNQYSKLIDLVNDLRVVFKKLSLKSQKNIPLIDIAKSRLMYELE